ncbi:hypothetical protein Slin15195_G007510 [Septoria linicola]|uniref:Uncharacterized protein n=1 Tax=Septoria linicola TaxID=215465 RepID=A0A9Q9EFA0_9PEZI|nr:hypothetical protein Slin14017_G007520 [Septoria linicola]USW47432.1 hypothetical protein Slin15195_G007510 [Septoria linicola]
MTVNMSIEGNSKPMMAAESMVPDSSSIVEEIGRGDLCLQNLKNRKLGTDTPIEGTAEPIVSTPVLRSGSMPGTPGRRTTPKIAGLRATFERAVSDGSVQPLRSPGRLEKSRSLEQAREQDLQAVRAKDEEIEKLKAKLEQETGLRHEFEDKYKRLQAESARWEAQRARQEIEWRGELERHMLERDKAQDEFIEIKRQLLSLKRSISLSTRLGNQVPDSDFTSEMQHLYHELQNWVVNSSRRVKTTKSATDMLACVEGIVEPMHVEYLQALFRNWNPTMKLPLLQAVTIYYFRDVWNDPLLFGLPTWRNGVQEAAEIFKTVLPLPAYNKWQAVTLDTLKQNADIKESVDLAAKKLTGTICTILGALTGAEESSVMETSLNVIVRRAISLSHVFSVQQRAHYQFILPQPGTPFDPAKMDDTSLEACSPSHAISCATFPLVVKHNEGLEEGVPSMSIVVKAKVLCCPW